MSILEAPGRPSHIAQATARMRAAARGRNIRMQHNEDLA
jgi:hypothetical protein